MNLPVREAQSATSSLPYGNSYALGKFSSLLLSIYLAFSLSLSFSLALSLTHHFQFTPHGLLSVLPMKRHFLR